MLSDAGLEDALCITSVKSKFTCILQRWKLQAEANDEAERVLSSQPMPVEQDLEAC